MSCGRSTSSRSAWRTLTSLNGGWSTRIVNGVIAPVCEATVFTPLTVPSAASSGPSNAPAASITPVVRASCREVLSGKSMTVTVSTYGSPDCQKFGFLVNTLRCSGVKLWYTNGPVPSGFCVAGLNPSGMMYR